MNKLLNFLMGLILAMIISCIFGSLLMSFWFKVSFLEILKTFTIDSIWGKALSIGSIPNILLFYLFLNRYNYMAARGVILSFVIIALFVFW